MNTVLPGERGTVEPTSALEHSPMCASVGYLYGTTDRPMPGRRRKPFLFKFNLGIDVHRVLSVQMRGRRLLPTSSCQLSKSFRRRPVGILVQNGTTFSCRRADVGNSSSRWRRVLRELNLGEPLRKLWHFIGNHQALLL